LALARGKVLRQPYGRCSPAIGLATHFGRRAYLAFMEREYAGGIHVIAATKDGKTEYWAAATRREHAVDEVRKALPPGWNATFTERRISVETARQLKMQRMSVSKLPTGTRFQ
jgi:hypothetical protein